MPARGKLAVMLLLCSQMLIAFAGTVTPVFASWLEGHFGINKAQLGVLLAVGGIGAALAGLVGGWLADRLGVRHVLGISLGCMAAGYLGCGLLWQFGPFAGALVLAGFGVAGFGVSAAAYLCAAFPDHRRQMMGVLQLAAAVGYCAAPLVANALLMQAGARPGAAGGWRFHGAFVACAALMAAFAAVSWGLVRPPAAQSEAEAAEAGPAPHAFPRLAAGFIILLAALHAGEGTLSVWFVRYCNARFPSPAFPPAWGLSAYGAAFILGRTYLSATAERRGNFRWLIVPGLVGGALYLGVAAAPTQLTAAAAFVLAGLFISIEYPTLIAFAARAWPGHGATLVGALGVSNTAAVLVLSAIIGGLADRGVPLGTAMLLPGLCILGFGAVACGWAVAASRGREQS